MAKKIAGVLALAIALCFVVASLAQAGPNDPVTEEKSCRQKILFRFEKELS